MRQLTEKEELILADIKAGKVQREITIKYRVGSSIITRLKREFDLQSPYRGYQPNKTRAKGEKIRNTKHENSFHTFKIRPCYITSDSFIENAF